MSRLRSGTGIWLVTLLALTGMAAAQPTGSIGGVVLDKDFEAPLPFVTVLVLETEQRATGTEDGTYVVRDVPAGTYTIVFSKEGYARQIRTDVVVTAGQLTDLDAELGGDFEEMEEFVVQDLRIGGGTEVGLLNLRMESPALIDSISADLMSRAGVSDAASALRLVSGATVQDGKFAVIRGLPDRYVSSQLNNVRLPTADEDKRAVQLDQFPSAIIESIQISKTFTPDQQGDASGGAVNVVTKSIPEETIFEFRSEVSYNTQVSGESDFLTYRGGGVEYWGRDDGGRDPQLGNLGGNWDGAVGVSRDDAPVDYKWSLAGGGKHEFDNGVTVGGFASLFHENDSSYFDDGFDDLLWQTAPGQPLEPQQTQVNGPGDFKTRLLDLEQGTQSVQWGALATIGIETENHEISFLYLYTRIAEDTATLAEDTRGKAFFFPGYDPNDESTPGHDDPDIAPYIRTETLQYTERITESFQLSGEHTLPFPDLEIGDVVRFDPPVLDWTVSKSSADLSQPDKRQFGSAWYPQRTIIPGILVIPSEFRQFLPAANVNLGNLQRIYKEISEDSDQVSVNLRLPFEQWTGDEGSFKFGLFDDSLVRRYDQDSYSNFFDPGAPNNFPADFDQFWSESFPNEFHPITAAEIDVDYRGEQDIDAWYFMVDLPLTSSLKVIGGVRYESTDLSIVNTPEAFVNWVPPGTSGVTTLNPGDADVFFEQDDVLPSIGLVLEPFENITLRASYSETIARQTFKELTPIIQQEFLGGPIFIGNPGLRTAALENYDLRLDWTPYQGGLVSVSYFYKDVTDPIEFVQRNAGFNFTTPANYPDGTLEGWEIEARQDLGRFVDGLEGLSIGANATFIDSEVSLPDDEILTFQGLGVPITTQDATNAPEHLFNVYLTYDLEATGTQFGLFYTVRGDTLVAGAGQATGNFVPAVYEKQFDTLNLSVTQRLGDHFRLKFQAKNLTDPEFEEVYRSTYIGSDVTKSSFTRGIDFSISLSAQFTF